MEKSVEEQERELDLQIKQVQLQKLEAERDEAKYRTSKGFRRNELIKGYGAIAGALAGIAAVGSLVWTIWQGVNQLELQREERTYARIENAIRDLNSDSSKLRLYAVSALRIFLRDTGRSERDAEILSAISYALATEKELRIRESMISLIDSIDVNTTAHVDLEKMLAELVSLSRSVVMKEKLWTNHSSSDFSARHDDATESQAQSIGEAITALLKKGTKISDMSAIYCAHCDFSGLNLDSVNFSESILYEADFSKTSLLKANFDGALLEKATFVSANLSEASFTNRRVYDSAPSYQSLQQLGTFSGANFSCADLSNANFSQFMLLILSSDTNDQAPYMTKKPPRFTGANLTGADFSDASVIVYLSGDLSRNLNRYIQNVSTKPKNLTESLRMVKFSDLTVLNEAHYSNFRLALLGFKRAFANANWKQAKLPKGISKILQKLESNEVFDESKLTPEVSQQLNNTFDADCAS